MMRRRGRRHRFKHVFHGAPGLTVIQQEVLEQIYAVKERGEKVTPDSIRERMNIPEIVTVLAELNSLGLASYSKGEISLSESGTDEARLIVRRNRLAEVLFNQVFEVPLDTSSELACRFEHLALNNDVTDSICTFLGHPPFCPHGRPIPKGACCESGRKEIEPMVKKLSELGVGDEGRVVFMRPSKHSFLDRLSSFGIVPGTILRVHQTKPSLVIQFEETTMAMEEKVADDIYLRVRQKR